MKYQFELKGTPEEVFDYNFNDVDSRYFESKKKHIRDLDSKKVTFQVQKTSQSAAVNRKAAKSNVVSYATIKVMKFDCPNSFAFDYKSDTYQKYTEYELISYDEKKGITTFTVYFYDSFIRNGVTKVRNSDSRELSRTPFLQKMEFSRSFRDYMKNREKQDV